MDNLGTGADILKGTSTALSAVGSLAEGRAARKASGAAGRAAKEAAKYEAGQLRRNAGATRASSQREAIEQRRAGRLAQSRAIAVAGASGGGVSDPTVVDIVANLAADGEYNALTALYNGEEAARGMEDAATGAEYNGRQEARGYKARGRAYEQAGYMTALGTSLDGASSFFEKYGGGSMGATSALAYASPGFRPPGIR